MNNKGQSLVIFVIILPILLMFCCYVIDMSLILYEKNHLDGINKTITSSYLKDKTINIEKLLLKNDKKIENIKIIGDDYLNVSYSKEIKSIFGNVIGIKTYKIKSKVEIKK